MDDEWFVEKAHGLESARVRDAENIRKPAAEAVPVYRYGGNGWREYDI